MLFPRSNLPRYSVVVEDSAWPESGGGGRGAQEHYPLMTVKQIIALPVVRALADDCHYWLWATDTHLPDAFDVMRSRGCRYVRTWSWVKCRTAGDVDDITEDDLQMGIGKYARSCHEHLILGTRGATSMPSPATRPKSVIPARRGEHSAKPERAWEIIEAVSAGRVGPRLELNARVARPGWTPVGHAFGTTIEGFLQPYLEAV